jgi:hypothetical protein
LNTAIRTASIIGREYFLQKNGSRVLHVQRCLNGREFRLNTVFVLAEAIEDSAGFVDSLACDQPAGALGVGEQQEEEGRGGEGLDAEHPTPVDVAEV